MTTIDGATKLAGVIGGDIRRMTCRVLLRGIIKYRFHRSVGAWLHGCGVVCGLCTAFLRAFWCVSLNFKIF